MEEKKEETKSYKLPKLVYFSDFGHLLTGLTDEVIENSREEQFCCRCAGTANDEICECIKRKERRDGTKEHEMSAGLMTLERACEIVVALATKTIDSIKERSFVCECSEYPPKKRALYQDK